MRRRLVELIPRLRELRELQLRLWGWIVDWGRRTRFASATPSERLPVEMVRHASVLRRRLRGLDPRLQETKIVNLRLAAARLDGLVIRPGEVLSLWRRIGRPTTRRGFVEGLTLEAGEVRTGIGGGLCQLSNLLHWMALHTPLEVVEAHHHAFDAFPDDRRTLPFGSGASVFYPAGDLRLANPTGQAFQVCVWLTDEELNGSILTDREWPLVYRVEERDHRFERSPDGRIVRHNELWRRACDRGTGATIALELVARNDAVLRYPVPPSLLAPRSRASLDADGGLRARRRAGGAGRKRAAVPRGHPEP